tara:strand:- start:574 stop:762 length:189 start_codon:yes stop_codon:yes gene_type:complete
MPGCTDLAKKSNAASLRSHQAKNATVAANQGHVIVYIVARGANIALMDGQMDGFGMHAFELT